jgi:protein tyrosine kinase modulator
MLGDRELTLDDYLGSLRRRWWVIVVFTMAGAGIGYLISLAIPAQYTSQTLVLVEQQKVPESFVKSVVTDELNQRLATMQEQILSRTRLEPIIQKFGLYKDDVGRVPAEELLDRMRKSIVVTPVRPVITTPVYNPNNQGIPGFSITFTTDNPKLAQQVCGEIASMFMEENLRIREQTAEGTTKFLEKQLEDAKRKLDGQDAKLAAFKRQYIGQLPEQEQTNLSILLGLKTQLESANQLLSRAQQDKSFTESLLAQQLSAWEASRATQNPETLRQQLTRLQTDLIGLEARYTSEHPDVIKMKRDIAELKKKIEEAEAAAKSKSGDTNQNAIRTEPPEIQQLRTSIHQAEDTIRVNTLEQQHLQNEIKVYEARVQLSPMVEEQYKDLTRDYHTALDFYDDLLKKKNQSEMSTDLERRQQGEQFRVMDPPDLPERPSFPNRPLFAGGGLGGGLALGLGIAILLEVRDKSMRSERDIEFFLKLPTLALMPSIPELNGKKKRFLGFARKEPAQASRGDEA